MSMIGSGLIRVVFIVAVVWQSLAAQLYRLQLSHKDLNIGHIFQSFRYRLTNVTREEFLSVSGMLDLDTKTLLDAEEDQRTKRFWLILRWLPHNVPFLVCPKLSGDKYFRWAPKTMMCQRRTTMDTDNDGLKVECTDEGLKGTHLMIHLDKLLEGAAVKKGSVFKIWIDRCESNVTQEGDHRAYVRLYCDDSWPKPPNNLHFDTIILPGGIPNAGQTVSAAALVSEDRVNGDSSSFSKSAHNAPNFQFVGIILVERLESKEFVNVRSTLMFEGVSKAVIDAGGVCSKERICVT